VAAGSAAAAEASSPVVAAVPETVVQVPSTPAPEAVDAAVKELETVAASYVQEKAPTPVQEAVAQATPPPEVPQTVEAPIEPTQVAAVAEADIPKLETAETDAPEPRHEEPKRHEETNEASVQAPSVATAASEVPVEPVPVSPVSPEITAVAAEPPVAKGSGDSAKKESEIAANTAAAWASWRRIRESGDPIAAQDADQGGSAPLDAAAMAVAAGAEKAAEQASAEDDPAAIASIVDSVLADLRPKIFEEVSRKMGKKK
jgi:hypothetical protein